MTPTKCTVAYRTTTMNNWRCCQLKVRMKSFTLNCPFSEHSVPARLTCSSSALCQKECAQGEYSVYIFLLFRWITGTANLSINDLSPHLSVQVSASRCLNGGIARLDLLPFSGNNSALSLLERQTTMIGKGIHHVDGQPCTAAMGISLSNGDWVAYGERYSTMPTGHWVNGANRAQDLQ